MATYKFYFAIFLLTIRTILSQDHSVLTFLDTTPSHLNILCQHNKSSIHLTNNFTITGSPQSIHEFYMCGFDNHSTLLPNNKYNITYTSSSLNYATFNHITPINNSTNLLSLQLNSFPLSIGKITLYSPFTTSNNITIFINLSNCLNRFYQNYNAITSSFNCTLCQNNTYSLDRNQCKQCKKGMICLNGNNIYIQKHYYGININNTIHTAYCLSNYCCNDINGCNPLNNINNSNNICIKNRNSSIPLCGLCDNTFCETMNTMNGMCIKCNDKSNNVKYIFFIFYLIICSFLVWILYNINYYLEKQKQNPDSWSPPTEFAICIWYNLLPFYQTLLYLHSYEFELQSQQEKKYYLWIINMHKQHFQLLNHYFGILYLYIVFSGVNFENKNVSNNAIDFGMAQLF